MDKKKEKKNADPKVEKPEEVDESTLPVLSLDDCETFDPSADKQNKPQGEEDDWEDEVDEQEDFSD